jgi:hypothetical protein
MWTATNVVTGVSTGTFAAAAGNITARPAAAPR